MSGQRALRLFYCAWCGDIWFEGEEQDDFITVSRFKLKRKNCRYCIVKMGKCACRWVKYRWDGI